MKLGIAGFIKNIGVKLLSGIRRFPEALFMAAVAVVLGIYLNHERYNLLVETRDIIMRILMVFALGIPLSLCIKIAFERTKTLGRVFKILLLAAGAVFLVFYYQFPLRELNFISGAKYTGIMLSLIVLFTFIPYLYKRRQYEMYIIKLFTGFIITYVYSLILYLGLAAIIFTIDRLFNANIDFKVYFDIFLVVGGLFALGYFLSEIPEQGEELQTDNYPKVLKVLLLNIVIPLTVAYTLILYVYFIKILITWSWPSGLVANLVLWFSIISSAVIFLVYVLRDTNRWVKVYTRWAPVAILPLLAMMFVSICIRLQAYGITERRYFAVVAGIWTTFYMLYTALRRSPRNIILAVSLSILAIISVFGPVSSFAISKLSQNMRFEAILKNNGMLAGNTIVKPTGEISDTDKQEITSIVNYFNYTHSLKDLRYMPQDFSIEQSEKYFGFNLQSYRPDNYLNEIYFSHILEGNNQFADIKDYDYFVQIPGIKVTEEIYNDGDLKIMFVAEKNELQIFKDGRNIYTGKPFEMAAEIHKANPGKQTLTSEEFRYIDENSAVKAMYAFRNIFGSENKTNNTLRIDMVDFNLFIKLK